MCLCKATCLHIDCCFDKSIKACWSCTKWTSSSFPWNVICFLAMIYLQTANLALNNNHTHRITIVVIFRWNTCTKTWDKHIWHFMYRILIWFYDLCSVYILKAFVLYCGVFREGIFSTACSNYLKQSCTGIGNTNTKRTSKWGFRI